MTASDSYDSDGGLEEISITDSKKQFAEKWYSVNKQLKAEKEKLKDKRRSHHLLCAQQKKQKSMNGKVKRNSSDEDSPGKLFESHKKVENKTKRVKFDDNVDGDIDDDGADDAVVEAEKLTKKPFSDEEETPQKRGPGVEGLNSSRADTTTAVQQQDTFICPTCVGGDCSADEEDKTNKSSDDFIPFDKKSGGVKPVYIKDFVKLDPGLERALAFKNKHLFGRHVHRQPMSSHMAMAEKRRALYPKKTNSATL